jgi:hypothetical protein
MDNGDLIVVLGLGVAAVGVALALPPLPPNRAWVQAVLGVVAAVAGLLAFLVVVTR